MSAMGTYAIYLEEEAEKAGYIKCCCDDPLEKIYKLPEEIYKKLENKAYRRFHKDYPNGYYNR